MNSLAAATSIHGQLQRGRGAGFRWALQEDPALVRPLLTDCVINDPRQDRQIETRSDYFAALIAHTHLQLDPFDAYLHTLEQSRPHDPNDLVLATISVLARSNYPQAMVILHDYAEYGEHLDLALEALGEAPGETISVAAMSALVDRRCTNDEELSDLIWGHFSEEEPWSSLQALNPRIAQAFEHYKDSREITKNQQAALQRSCDGLSVATLLSSANVNNYRFASKAIKQRATARDFDMLSKTLHDSDQWRRVVALRGLEALADPRGLRLLQEIIESADTRPRLECKAAREAFEALSPELTLDLGRTWFDTQGGVAQWAGQMLLEKHATIADVERARNALKAAIDQAHLGEEDHYLVIGMITILSRFPERGPFPEIEDAFVEAQHSWTRIWAASALAELEIDRFSTAFAAECLWDCEDRVKELGCKHAALNDPAVRERLIGLAQNLSGDSDVLEAARLRLESS